MRYGTRTHCKRRWTPQGQRPICQVKLGYDWAYLYVALCPFTGDTFAMFFSHLDKACFAKFMECFIQYKKQQQQEVSLLLIGDGATAHTSQDWDNCQQIDWVKQPTACPELNPVERFFEELRRHTSNRVFANKQEVEDKIELLIKQYMDQPKKVRSLTLFPYIKSSENNSF